MTPTRSLRPPPRLTAAAVLAVVVLALVLLARTDLRSAPVAPDVPGTSADLRLSGT